MNTTSEIEIPTGPTAAMPPHEQLMRRHLQEENLPQAVLPACPVNRVLKGQKALVTGANSGIGQAVAVALAQAGADVAVNYVTHPEAADATVKEIASHGVNAYAHQADISREDQVQAMFRKMIHEFGTIDILVNNAGLQKDSPIENMTLADWQLVINVNLTGQKALITGANSGIGQAVALALAQAGADVVINYVTHSEAAEAVAQEAAGHGVKAYAHQADISREDQVQAMFRKMIQEFGTIDILVNNAGLQKDAPVENMTLADWQLVINVNLTGQFLCAREAIREFKRRGVRPEISCAAGKIICMSSVHEVIPWAGHVNYAASKGGVMLMMKSIAQEVAPYRIRVNSICPGAIRTPINTGAWSTPEAYRRLMKLVPYKRIGEPNDIGHAAI